MDKLLRKIYSIADITHSHPLAVGLLMLCSLLYVIIMICGLPGMVDMTMEGLLSRSGSGHKAAFTFEILVLLSVIITAIAVIVELLAISITFGVASSIATSKLVRGFVLVLLAVLAVYAHTLWTELLSESLTSVFAAGGLSPKVEWVNKVMMLVTIAQTVSAMFVGVPMKFIGEMIWMKLTIAQAEEAEHQIRTVMQASTNAQVMQITAGTPAGRGGLNALMDGIRMQLSPGQHAPWIPSDHQLRSILDVYPGLKNVREDVRILPNGNIGVKADGRGFTESGGVYLGPHGKAPVEIPATFDRGSHLASANSPNHQRDTNDDSRIWATAGTETNQFLCPSCGNQITIQRGQIGGVCSGCSTNLSFPYNPPPQR